MNRKQKYYIPEKKKDYNDNTHNKIRKKKDNNNNIKQNKIIILGRFAILNLIHSVMNMIEPKVQ